MRFHTKEFLGVGCSLNSAFTGLENPTSTPRGNCRTSRRSNENETETNRRVGNHADYSAWLCRTGIPSNSIKGHPNDHDKENDSFVARHLLFKRNSIFARAETPEKPKPEHFAAVALLPQHTARTASQVDVRINAYMDEAETPRLAGMLIEGGQDAVVKAFEKMKPIGSIRLSRRVGFYDFTLVRSRKTETGRRIVAVSDRPFGFLEVYYGGRSRDYQLGILILDLKTDKKGKEVGEGKLFYATKVKIGEGNLIEIENYGRDPIRLANVRKY